MPMTAADNLSLGQIHIFYLHQAAVWERMGDPRFFLDMIHPDQGGLSAQHPGRQREKIMGRALVGAALSWLLNLPAPYFELDRRPSGKPILARGMPSLSFNLSHAKDVIVLAVSRDFDLGVDVENIHRRVNLTIADRFFSPGEQKQLKNAPSKIQSRLFLELWTLKEAYAKAVGEGIFGAALGECEFDLSLSPFGFIRSGRSVSPRAAYFFKGYLASRYPLALCLLPQGQKVPGVCLWEWDGHGFARRSWTFDTNA